MKTKPFQYREITGHWRQKHDDKNVQNEPNETWRRKERSSLL